MKRLLLLLSLFLLSTAASLRAQERIVFTPQWTAQAQFAGYYAACEQGFYREEGLEVEIIHPTVTFPAMTRINRGLSQVTTLQLCQAMEIIDQGVPMVNILQTSMNNAMVIISRKGGDPLELKGARVATWSIGFGQIAECMSIRDHLDYDWVRSATSVNLFIKEAIDALLAMSYNEYWQLVQAGHTFDADDIYRFSDHGYNVQEDGVYVTRNWYEGHRSEAEAFARASRRGWEWVAEHPDEALDIVMRYVTENYVATNRVLQKKMLEDILRLQIDRESGAREFRLRPDMVSLASDLMVECYMLGRPITYEELLPEVK